MKIKSKVVNITRGKKFKFVAHMQLIRTREEFVCIYGYKVYEQTKFKTWKWVYETQSTEERIDRDDWIDLAVREFKVQLPTIERRKAEKPLTELQLIKREIAEKIIKAV